MSWLEEYLRAYRGGVLIVSHDRFLLDRVADHIAEIEDTRLRQFDGNYTAYQQKKAAENAMLLKRAETIARERARLQESIQRLFSFRQFTRMRSLQKAVIQIGIHHPARRSGEDPHGLQAAAAERARSARRARSAQTLHRGTAAGRT